MEAVLVDDFVWDACQGDFHILVSGHGGSIIEVLDVQGHEAGTGSRYGAV